MKKLISLSDIEAAIQKGEKQIVVDDNTLITPSAKDAALSADIAFVEAAATTKACGLEGNASTEDELIYKALQILVEKGLIGQLMSVFGNEVPYVSESDASGMLKLVRGNSAKWQPLDIGNDPAKVSYNTLIYRADGAVMSAGFMLIEYGNFSWMTECQEIYYVVEGTLSVEKDGKLFKAHAGDCLFFKKGAQLKLSVEEKVKVFYVTD